jgi:hypothetical protein
MGLTLGSIGGSNLGSAGDSTKESSLTSKASMSWGSLPIPQTCRCFQGDQIQNSFCEKFTRKLIYFAIDLFLPNSPRSSLHPNNTNRINRRMTALPNAKKTLLIAIDMVIRLYADATATTQETVSRVSSSNLSSIDDDGELLVSSCLGCFSKKQLPSLFPLVTYGRMHGKQRTGLDGVQRDNGQTRPWSSWP